MSTNQRYDQSDDESVVSTKPTPPSFRLQKLPGELQDEIWKWTARIPRVIPIALEDAVLRFAQTRAIQTDVARAGTSQSVHALMKAPYEFLGLSGEDPDLFDVLINFNVDTLYLTDGGNDPGIWRVGQDGRIGMGRMLSFLVPEQKRRLRSLAINDFWLTVGMESTRHFWGPALLSNHIRHLPALDELILVIAPDRYVTELSKREKSNRMVRILRMFQRQFEGVKRQESAWYHNLPLVEKSLRFEEGAPRVVRFKLMSWDSLEKDLVQEYVLQDGMEVPAFVNLEMVRGRLLEPSGQDVFTPDRENAACFQFTEFP